MVLAYGGAILAILHPLFSLEIPVGFGSVSFPMDFLWTINGIISGRTCQYLEFKVGSYSVYFWLLTNQRYAASSVPNIDKHLVRRPCTATKIFNTSNYVDTFAEYIISLIMLWTVLILPWWLLLIFRDYCCDGIYSMKNILLSMYDPNANQSRWSKWPNAYASTYWNREHITWSSNQHQAAGWNED